MSLSPRLAAKIPGVKPIRSLVPFAAFVAMATPGGISAQAPPDTGAVKPPAAVTVRDLGWLAGTGGLAALAQRADASVRSEVRGPASQSNATFGALADIGNGWGQPGVVVLGAALWGGGLYARNEGVAAVGLRALEAITVSSVVTKVLKGAFGRARPRVAPADAWDVEFGRGFGSGNGDYESFPSGHSTAAFAFAAAVTSEVAHRAPRHARLVGVASYTMALSTAYARTYRDAHWLSDVTMGAGIGIVGGLAVTRWHRTRPGNRVDALLLGPAMRPLVRPAGDGRTELGVTFSWR